MYGHEVVALALTPDFAKFFGVGSLDAWCS